MKCFASFSTIILFFACGAFCIKPAKAQEELTYIDYPFDGFTNGVVQTFSIEIDEDNVICDLEIVVGGGSAYYEKVSVTVISPETTSAQLWEPTTCTSDTSFGSSATSVRFADEYSNTNVCDGLFSYKPFQAFDRFIGESSKGTWKLEVYQPAEDLQYGMLEQWQIHITTCTESTYEGSGVDFYAGDTVSSTLKIEDDHEICDVNVSYEAIGPDKKDWVVTVTNPNGASVQLYETVGEFCGSGSTLDSSNNFRFDDEGGDGDICTGPYSTGLVPFQALSQFDGANSRGDWKLEVFNSGTSSAASAIESWALEITECPPDTKTYTGVGMGDPHIQTWSGEWYDFHGECDLIFLRDTNFGDGKGLAIQIRTKARDNFSFIQSAAVGVGRDVLEVTAYGQYLVNGVNMASMPNTLGGYTVDYKAESDKKHSFVIDLGERMSIIVQVFKDLVSVKLDGANKKVFGESQGLLGEFGTGRWMSRNGTVFTDPIQFGMEYQVLESEENLFWTRRYPQHPVQCIMPDLTKKEGRRRLGESIALEAAEKACQHWGDQKDHCVYDVLAMGDLELAEAGAV